MKKDSKNITYLNQDFLDFKQNLINFSKIYFPNTYNDFNESSPGMMFIKITSYVGDILSFYLNNQIQENYIQFARQPSNLYNLAYLYGYKPKITAPSLVEVDFYQILPSKEISSEWVPDFDYALYLENNSLIKTKNSPETTFLIKDNIDFSFSSSQDSTEVNVYSIQDNKPESFLIKKTRKAQSSDIKIQTFTINNPEQFLTLEIEDENIIGILDVKDSDGNIWYEVDYLAQDTIFDFVKNTNINDPNYNPYNDDTPYLLKLKKIERRFVTRFKNKTKLQIQFGSGTTNDSNEEIIPNPNNVGIGLPFEQTKLTTAYSPVNFMFTNSYGISPSNTTLTIRYLVGGGIKSNIQSGVLGELKTDTLKFLNSNLNETLAQEIYDSFEINNPNSAYGGSDGDTNEEIRLNSISQFANQLRIVTEQDYVIRTLSMPSKFGSISKAFVTPKKTTDLFLNIEKNSSVDLYVLTYNRNRQLEIASLGIKNNLKTYLSQYRIIGDSINIKNAYIINIGVEFEIITLPDYNSNEIIIKCIEKLKTYFDIDRWNINQPILLKEIYIELDKVPGVQTVKSVKITNKAGNSLGYSEFGYDILGATIDNVVYPSIDPSIFEVRYPDTDIKGRVSSF